RSFRPSRGQSLHVGVKIQSHNFVALRAPLIAQGGPFVEGSRRSLDASVRRSLPSTRPPDGRCEPLRGERPVLCDAPGPVRRNRGKRGHFGGSDPSVPVHGTLVSPRSRLAGGRGGPCPRRARRAPADPRRPAPPVAAFPGCASPVPAGEPPVARIEADQ